jgi:GNAT superfamily N-acetyltransferase
VGWHFLSLSDTPEIDRTCFDCGNPGVNKFFVDSVEKYEREGFSRVFLMLSDENKIVGYYTLSSSTIPLREMPNKYSKGLPRHDIPAVLIGQFGIDKLWQGKGLSGKLLGDAYSRIVLHYKQSAIAFHAVRVDTIDDKANEFWQKQGFICFKDSKQSLFVPVKQIVNIFEE